MITWILLLLLVCKSAQNGNGQEKGVLQCGPQNLTLMHSDQMILLTWEDGASCSAVNDMLIYELVVVIADKRVHYEEVAVMPDQIGSTHSWNWTSYLALECASHSVMLRSRYKNLTSPWKQEQTLPAIENAKLPQVFPQDRVYKVGSRVTFCCVLPAGHIFKKMYLPMCDGCDMNTTKISNQIYTLSVQLNQETPDSCAEVLCESTATQHGACTYTDYPPSDKDLECETRDLESVDCHWTVGRETHFKNPTVYQLLGRPCAKKPQGRCSQKEQVDVGERNWTVTAQNRLGKVELHDSADLTKRVHMFVPEGVIASTVNARNVSLEWKWTVQQYNNLNLTCQVNVSHGETSTTSKNFGVGLHFVVLNDLIPHWTYNVTVRCGTAQHFWKWSDWSANVNFRTKADVPDPLDVWTQVKGNRVIIIWKKPLANQGHGHIKDYEVTWAKTTEREQQNRTKVHQHRLALSLDTTAEYIVQVTARNIKGSSSPSTIIIPSLNPGVLQCGPQNLTLMSSDQMILLTWEDGASCSAVNDMLIYELVVVIADKRVHYEEVAVMPDQIGSTHSWNWTSYLALECASHSVMLRSRYKNLTSPWKQEQTLPAIENAKLPQVFPQDRVYKVGSRVTFCCVLPAGHIFKKMYLPMCDGCDMNTTKISNQIYTLSVQLNQETPDSCAEVLCESTATQHGACTYTDYPPSDKDLECETRDLESVDCHWTVGRETHFKNPTVYQLLGRPCAKKPQGRCSQKEQVDVGERNWTVTAQNRLGKVELHDSADLTKRVHMSAPEGVIASTVNARNVSLEWKWTVQQYNNLNLTCQVNVSHGETSTTSKNFGVGLHFVVLNDLIPHWTYNVTVRCGTAQHFWKWSDWSANVNFRTKADVPDPLDVWMQVKGNRVIIIWKKPLANQGHGHIKDYEVTWAKTTEREQQNRTNVHQHRLALSLDTTAEYIVQVTARNIKGSSSPSTIIIPSLNPESSDRTKGVNTSSIIGSNGSFKLSWSASPIASCGYIVDWCPTLGNCSVQWLKVPPSETRANIFSEKFTDGVRYSLSVYACTQGAPVLLERREGYVNEKRMENGLFKTLKLKQRDSNVEVSWDPINLREQPAFIQGYVLYCSDDSNSITISSSTDNPEATSLIVRNIIISSYTFTVKAQTAVGECGTSELHATLNTSTDNLITSVIISLVIVFGLLSLITILCYRHWTCIKQEVCPPVPKPVLREMKTSPAEDNCHPLHMDQWYHREADVINIQELYCAPGAPVNGVSQESVKKCSSPPLTTAAIRSQSGLPSSPFRGVFPNLSYNLMIQTGDQQSNSGPDLQEGTPLERSSSGYQPQSNEETFTINQMEEYPDSPISCVSTYILLPQSPST